MQSNIESNVRYILEPTKMIDTVYKTYTNLYIFDCYHYMCYECYTSIKNKCPVCKQEIKNNEFIKKVLENNENIDQNDIPTKEHQQKILNLIKHDLYNVEDDITRNNNLDYENNNKYNFLNEID